MPSVNLNGFSDDSLTPLDNTAISSSSTGTGRGQTGGTSSGNDKNSKLSDDQVNSIEYRLAQLTGRKPKSASKRPSGHSALGSSSSTASSKRPRPSHGGIKHSITPVLGVQSKPQAQRTLLPLQQQQQQPNQNLQAMIQNSNMNSINNGIGGSGGSGSGAPLTEHDMMAMLQKLQKKVGSNVKITNIQIADASNFDLNSLLNSNNAGYSNAAPYTAASGTGGAGFGNAIDSYPASNDDSLTPRCSSPGVSAWMDRQSDFGGGQSDFGGGQSDFGGDSPFMTIQEESERDMLGEFESSELADLDGLGPRIEQL